MSKRTNLTNNAELNKYKQIDQSLKPLANKTLKNITETFTDVMDSILDTYVQLSDPQNLIKIKKWPRLENYVEEQISALMSSSRINVSEMILELSKGVSETRFSSEKFEKISEGIIENLGQKKFKTPNSLAIGVSNISVMLNNFDVINENYNQEFYTPREIIPQTSLKKQQQHREMQKNKTKGFHSKIAISPDIQRSKKTFEKVKSESCENLRKVGQHYNGFKSPKDSVNYII